MSELSEAEKRKILRERRQNKFSNGGGASRLNKITGQADSHLSTDSPLDQRKQETSSPSFDDPPEHEVTEATNIPTKSNSKATPELPANNPQVDLFKKLASMENKNDSTPDLFSILKSMNGTGSENGPINDLAQAEISPVDQELLKYHDYLVNRLMAKTILCKWVFFIIPYIYLVSRGNRSTLIPVPDFLSIFTNPSYFFMIFTTFEMIATSIYYQKLQTIEKAHNVNKLDTSNKIIKLITLIPEGLIPISDLKGKVILLLQYWNVLSLFLSDICFVLFITGIISYF